LVPEIIPNPSSICGFSVGECELSKTVSVVSSRSTEETTIRSGLISGIGSGSSSGVGVRRERGFAGVRTQIYVSREVPLREQIREWEQDEQRKMEQERQALRGARRNLDHLKRGDLRSSDEEMDQSSGSEDQKVTIRIS
jgi:hypothetical protein